MYLQARAAKKHGVAYLTTDSDDECLQTADVEAARQAEKLLEEIESPLLKEEITAAKRERGVAEVVVDLGEDEMRSDALAEEAEDVVGMSGTDEREKR